MTENLTTEQTQNGGTANPKAALVQFDILPGQTALNEAAAERLIVKSAELGADMVVLPELWNVGYDLPQLGNLAQDMGGSSIKLLSRLARENNIFIFGGSIAEIKNGRYYNTAPVFNQKGDLIHKYRKLHLFPLGLEEDKYFTAGDEWGLVDTPWGTFGVALCYDLRFPALLENLALRGAQALVIPAQWPTIRINHWLLLNQARAIENQAFVLACNRTGKDKSGKYSGCSMLVDPFGGIISGGAEANHPGVLLGELDFGLLPKCRRGIPFYSDRRRIIDEIDDSQF